MPDSKPPSSAPPSRRVPLPVEVGQVFAGKYRVDRVLGHGGMGAVVAVTHVELGQRFAVKFMLPTALKDTGAIARFQREARATVKLRSDHVTRVYDVGRLDGTAIPFIVMEYLEGRDLDEVVHERGPLPVGEAVEYMLQVCEGVAEAHAMGIIHRDLKPKNLYLVERSNGLPLVKVLDFGISKMAEDPTMLDLTSTTDVIGSPLYMSPEQLRTSKSADERSDLWSLGAILYELVTGALPFPAESVTELVSRVIQDPPRPLAQFVVGVPSAVEAVILKCLEKDPAKRFTSVNEMILALEPYSTYPRIPRDRASYGSGRGSGPSVPPPDDSSGRVVVRPSNFTGSADSGSDWARTELALSTNGSKAHSGLPMKKSGVALVPFLLGIIIAGGAAGLFVVMNQKTSVTTAASAHAVSEPVGPTVVRNPGPEPLPTSVPAPPQVTSTPVAPPVAATSVVPAVTAEPVAQPVPVVRAPVVDAGTKPPAVRTAPTSPTPLGVDDLPSSRH
ncbi:MAG: protein kinase [Polyangiaceae bacterium]